MKNTGEGILKRLMLVMVALLTLVAIMGCNGETVNSADARIRINLGNIGVFTQEVKKARASWVEPETDDASLDTPTYQIIVDGNLGALTNWGSEEAGDYGTGNGFLDKKCTTYDSLILLLSEITSGQKVFGYFSCEAGEANSISDSAKASGALGANYFSYDSNFSADSNNTRYYKAHKNLANLVSDVAKTAAQNAAPDDVFILITDLAMQNEDQSKQIADALTKYVITNDSLTMSLIGVKAKYVGKINNVPRTSLGIEPKRIFGDPNNSAKAYDRYVYLLLIGSPEQVYETTNQIVEKCKNNRNLSGDDQVKSVFFSGLKCASNTDASAGAIAQQEIKPELSYCGNIAAYGAAGYDKRFTFVLTDDISKEDSDAIDEIPFAKVYSGASAPTDENITVTCKFPFIIRSYPAQTAAGGATYSFSGNNPTVSVSEVKQLDLVEKEGGLSADINGWIACGAKMLTLSGEPVFDEENGTFQMGFTVNTTALTKDLPLILSVTVQPSFMPDRSELLKTYGADWLLTWSMDMAVYNSEWDGHAFKFTQATNTAYLAETFYYNLLDRQIDQSIADATEEMSGYEKTFVFGVVQHDVASAYVAKGKKVESDNNFGWAFSQDEADAFPNQ